jgi:hypothetical protein
MEKITNKVLDYEVPLDIPSSVEEYNNLDKSRTNACLDDANKYTILHGWNSDARDIIVEVLEKLTGVKRKMKPGAQRKDGSAGAEVPDETHKVYKDRALAESKKNHEDTVADVLNALAPLAFDPSPAERSGGVGRVRKEYYLIADGILEKGTDVAAKAVRKLRKLNPGLEIKVLEDNTPDRDSLAAAVQVNAIRIAKQASEDLIAA